MNFETRITIVVDIKAKSAQTFDEPLGIVRVYVSFAYSTR